MSPTEPQEMPRRTQRRGSTTQAHRTLRSRIASRVAALLRPRSVRASARAVRWDGLAVLAASLLLLGLFGNADVFYVSRVDVEGNRMAAADKVVTASGVRNYNVFFLQFSEITGRVRGLSGVRDAEAWLELPNVVHIRLSEYVPVMAWNNGSDTRWADENGNLYSLGPIPADLVVVRDLDGGRIERVDAQLISAIKRISAALPSVKRMDYSRTRGGLSFNEEHGWKVLFGDDDQVNAKLAMLQTLSAYLAAQKIDPEYVDVRLPDRAYYKPR